ncbi:MAG: DUF167 domain-containing protein [Patescibacteria group bacterium]
MRITVRVQTGASRASITTLEDGTYRVAVHEHPEKGNANEAVRKALANHFHTAPSRISIIAGHAARTKIIDIT